MNLTKIKITIITISLRVNDEQLFKKYNKTQKNSILMRIDFESKPFYGDDDDNKYIKTKKYIYEQNIIMNFHNKKMPKEGVPCKCL